MAEVKLMKINTNGILEEHGSSDDVTFDGYTASETGGYTVTDGVTITDNITFDDVADTIAGIENQNLVDKTASESISGNWDFSTGEFTFPNAVSTSPAEGDSYWDGTSDILYAYDGSAWIPVGGICDKTVIKYKGGTGGIAQYDAVYISGDDTVLKADASAIGTAKVIGFAPDAIAATVLGEVQINGILTVLTGATAGAPYFLSTTAGLLTTTPPAGSGEVVVLVGYAKNATTLHIQIQGLRIRA